MPQWNAVHLPTEEHTLALGARLARRISPGVVVGLHGELGAGKTTLVRGLLRELGFDGEVRSPTFTLLQTYDTAPPICHVDLYRLDRPQQVEDLGIGDYLGTHAVLVEWLERSGGTLPADIEVRLEFSGEGRSAEVSGVEL